MPLGVNYWVYERNIFIIIKIERVNGKRMVGNEFAEAMRVLKLAVDRDVLEHLQQLEYKKIQILHLSIR
jgi:hypothetical protein